MSDPYYYLHGEQVTLLIKAPIGEPPLILYWGDRIDGPVSGDKFLTLRTRQSALGGAFVEVPATLSCEHGTGYLGPAGLQAHREGTGWAPVLKVQGVDQEENEIVVECGDVVHGVSVEYRFELDRESNVFRIESRLTNHGDGPLTINWLSACCIPVAIELSEIISFSGRWAAEFQIDRAPLPRTGFVSENRRGRTSHDRFPGLVLCAPYTTERDGPCIGIHLGWSGNTRLRVDTLADGRRVFQGGEHFLPGEMKVGPGKTYFSPALYVRYSGSGVSAMSNGFHDYYHGRLADSRTKNRPRPVHYNTWEAIYFDHSEAVLKELADAAASLGIERFVLDDGWFKGRRSDQAGLGDWTVDRNIYPAGLGPIISYVRATGMEFGLWVEPEMINEDSDLFRAHPDWVLATPPAVQTPFRHQLVLDISREEVAENIFRQIDALLTEYDISYLKWDMNRDLNHPGGADGGPSIHRQTLAVYSLIEQLRERHPNVEIESCSSGGARADYGVLEHTDRIWTSDSNDALDRQLIQRGASFFFPLSIMGAHVGPQECHITNRSLSMGLRSATAMFGAMGVEADLLEMDNEERHELREAISLFKDHRDLIHGGRFIRLDGPAFQNTVGVIAKDKSEALFSHTQLGTCRDILPGVLRFPELSPYQNYRLKVVWPTRVKTPVPHRLEKSGLLEDGYEASGEELAKFGVQLPQLFPETAIVFHLLAK